VHRFPLPSDIPAGQYQAEIGVYSRTDMRRFAVLEEGQAVADRLLLEPISVMIGNANLVENRLASCCDRLEVLLLQLFGELL